MEYITLTNGVKVPVLAYGCNTLGRSTDDWTMEPDGDYRPFYYALNAGYRYFDDAIDYHNESELGALLSNSHIKRSDLFISSKLPERDKYITTEETVSCYINRSLERFHTDYLDMYLIHRPSKDTEGLLRAWHVLERYYKEGKIRVIGVSNFEIPLLKIFLAKAEIKPMINQIMINPGCWHNELISFCQQNDIRPAAWSPLRNLTSENKEILKQIGQKYNKTWAQVLLRYYLQRNISVITKSHVEKEVRQNINIFDFILSPEEINIISSLKGTESKFPLPGEE